MGTAAKPKPAPSMLAERIQEILNRKDFPDAQAWCRAAKVSEGYLATLRRRLKLGQVQSGKVPELRKLAKAAGVSLLWLLGEDDTPEPNMGLLTDRSIGDFLETIRVRHGLTALILTRGSEWHTRTVIRALEYTEPHHQHIAASMKWWAKLLTSLERGRVPKPVENPDDA